MPIGDKLIPHDKWEIVDGPEGWGLVSPKGIVVKITPTYKEIHKLYLMETK